MSRNPLLIALTSAIVAVIVTAGRAEETDIPRSPVLGGVRPVIVAAGRAEETDRPCAQGTCLASCTANTCRTIASAADALAASISAVHTCAAHTCAAHTCTADTCAVNTSTTKTCTVNTPTANTCTADAANARAANTSTANAGTGSTCTANTCTASTCTGNTCTGNTCTGNTCTGSSCTGNTSTVNTSTGTKDGVGSTAAIRQCNTGSACVASGLTAGVDGCKCGADSPCVAAATSHQAEHASGHDCRASVTAFVAPDVLAHVVLLQERLVQEMATNAFLEAQLQFHAELATAKEDFAKRMLQKETEIAKLHADLRLAHERTQMNQKVVAAMADNARLKASVELTHDRYEMLKHVIAKKNAQQTEDLDVSLARSKEKNAKLMERIVALEQQLETLRVRLANHPEGGHVK